MKKSYKTYSQVVTLNGVYITYTEVGKESSIYWKAFMEFFHISLAFEHLHQQRGWQERMHPHQFLDDNK